MRFDGDAGGAALDAVRVGELDKDAAARRVERDGTRGGAEDRKGRRRIAAIAVVTLAAGGARHWPVGGLVWHSVSASGRLAEPVFAVAVIVEPAPTLSVATAKAADPLVPVMCRMPSLEVVAPSATTSDTGAAEAESSSVSRPTTTPAGPA